MSARRAMAVRLLALAAAAIGHVRGLEIHPRGGLEGNSTDDLAGVDRHRKLGVSKPAEKLHVSVCDVRSSKKRLQDCKICRMVESRDQPPPTLYARERGDGCGARLQDIIMWAAVAYKNRMRFGGVISTGACRESHGANIFRAVQAVLGMEKPEDLFTEHPPQMDREYRGVNDFHRKFVNGWWKREDYMAGANVLVGDACIACALDDERQYKQSDFLTPKFRKTLREASPMLRRGFIDWLPSPEHQAERPLVALHIRRGDVVKDTHDEYRLTPDSWYMKVVDRIRSVIPKADVHVFSSTERKYDEEDFEMYEKKRMTVHLDGEIQDAWAGLAVAKVLVMAKSSFSHVAALMSDGCVIYQPYWHNPLDHWIVALGADETPTKPDQPVFDAEQLRDCLAGNTGWNSLAAVAARHKRQARNRAEAEAEAKRTAGSQ